MKKWLFPLCGALALVAPCAFSIDVPLHYVRPPEVKAPELCVAAMRVATSDISKDPPSAPYLYDVQTSAGKGLAMSAVETSFTEEAGRKAVRRGMKLIVEDAALREGKRDLWVAVDYFDARTTGGQLSLMARVKGDKRDSSIYKEGPEFTGAGTWKQHVFHLKNVEFCARDIDKGDLEVSSYPVRPYSPSGYAFPQMEAKPPAGTFKLPKFVSKQPGYSSVKMGAKERLVVVDKTKESDKFYSRLYFDANGNSDLTDDKVLETTPTVDANSCRADFGQVEITLEQDGKSYPFAFRVGCYYYGSAPAEFAEEQFRNQMVRLQLNTACHFAGSFDQDGKTYYLALGDRNCDGSFTGKMAPYENYVGDTLNFQGDIFALSDDEKMKSAKSFIHGDQLLLGKQLFDVAVDLPAGKLTLTPVSGEKGTLKLPQAVKKIQLLSDQKKSIMCMDCGESLQVPPAQYAFYEYTLERTEGKGAKWELRACATPDTTATKVTAGSETKLVFGEPFCPTVGLPAWERQNLRYSMGNTGPETKSGGVMSWFFGTKSSSEKKVSTRPVNLEMQVRGAGGELLSSLSLLEGESAIELDSSRNRPKTPTYVISKADGELVTKGTFEYG